VEWLTWIKATHHEKQALKTDAGNHWLDSLLTQLEAGFDDFDERYNAESGLDAAWAESSQEAEDVFKLVAARHPDGDHISITKEELVKAHDGDYGIFDKIDVDSDGNLTLDEWYDWLKRTHLEKGGAWLTSILHTLSRHLKAEAEAAAKVEGVARQEKMENSRRQPAAVQQRNEGSRSHSAVDHILATRYAADVAMLKASLRESDNLQLQYILANNELRNHADRLNEDKQLLARRLESCQEKLLEASRVLQEADLERSAWSVDNSSFAAERRRWHKEMEIAYQAICDLESQNETLRGQLNAPETPPTESRMGEQYSEREKEMLERFKRRETGLMGELSAIERERNDMRRALMEAAKEMTVLEHEKARMRQMIPPMQAQRGASQSSNSDLLAATGVIHGHSMHAPGWEGMKARATPLVPAGEMARELEVMRRDLLQTTADMTTRVRQGRQGSPAGSGASAGPHLNPSVPESQFMQATCTYTGEERRVAALEEQARANKAKIAALLQQVEEVKNNKAASYALREW